MEGVCSSVTLRSIPIRLRDIVSQKTIVWSFFKLLLTFHRVWDRHNTAVQPTYCAFSSQHSSITICIVPFLSARFNSCHLLGHVTMIRQLTWTEPKYAYFRKVYCDVVSTWRKRRVPPASHLSLCTLTMHYYWILVLHSSVSPSFQFQFSVYIYFIREVYKMENVSGVLFPFTLMIKRRRNFMFVDDLRGISLNNLEDFRISYRWISIPESKWQESADVMLSAAILS